jgi:hypothetical protein
MSGPANKIFINSKGTPRFNLKPKRISTLKRKLSENHSSPFNRYKAFSKHPYCKPTSPSTKRKSLILSLNQPLPKCQFPSSKRKMLKAIHQSSRSKGCRKSGKVTSSKTIIKIQQTISSIPVVNK